MSDDNIAIGKRLDELESRILNIERLIESKPKDFEGKKISLKEFILQKNPGSDVEKALAIAYYVEKYQGLSSFNSMDIEKGFRNAGEKVPDNVTDKIRKSISKGHMMNAEEKKDDHNAYVLTNSGERFVEGGFGKK